MLVSIAISHRNIEFEHDQSFTQSNIFLDISLTNHSGELCLGPN